jgi:hypothetical protein
VPSSDNQSTSANFIPVGTNYFDTVSVQLVAGRTFTTLDDQIIRRADR